jgi:glycosyltransferase involved in cell wall biosynthesis
MQAEPATSRFSVVIPTIGRPSLERAVNSVVQQTLLPAEIIVVHNGSDPLGPDREARLAATATKGLLTVLTLPPMSGPSISRNVGAWDAQTDYVAFLDDDDEFTSRYLEAMSNRIDRDRPDVLYGAKVWRDAEGSVIREKRLDSVDRNKWFEFLYRGANHGVGGQNLVASRAAFFELGAFSVDLPSGEDRAFALAALAANATIVYVDEAEVSCHDPEGIRSRGRSDKWITNLKLIVQYWDYVSWGTRAGATVSWLRPLIISKSRSFTKR